MYWIIYFCTQYDIFWDSISDIFVLDLIWDFFAQYDGSIISVLNILFESILFRFYLFLFPF